jgi:hypothetical protein
MWWQETHHGSIEQGIVEFRVGGEQLAAQKGGICDIGEQGDVDGVGVVVGECEGAHRGHGGRRLDGWTVGREGGARRLVSGRWSLVAGLWSLVSGRWSLIAGL